ncbi:MAG: helix-turn-helix domain-containing protein [Candidatus Ornithomonoglobus sp.]
MKLVNLDNLFDLLQQKGISAKKLSEDTGISTGNISDWKSGRSMPTAIKLDTIANYFDCSVDYLLGREPRQSVTVSNAHDNVGVVGQANAPVTIHNGTERQLTTHEKDLLRIYNDVDGKKQMKLMQFAYELEEDK